MYFITKTKFGKKDLIQGTTGKYLWKDAVFYQQIIIFGVGKHFQRSRS